MKQAKRKSFFYPPISLSITVASESENLPTRAQFLRWSRMGLQHRLPEAILSVLILDEPQARALNTKYRGKDYATNVLSFALNEHDTLSHMPLIGDIVLCAPVVAKEALAQQKPLLVHYAHLFLHGLLHLQGYDHEQENDAQIMETLETNLLNRLGYPNPY